MSRIAEGAVAERNLPDGRNLAVLALAFGNHRLVVSADDSTPFYDDGW
jgi:hypothetical protein